MKTTKKCQKNTAQKVSLEKLHIVGPGPVSVGHEVCATQGPGCNTLLPGGKACCAGLVPSECLYYCRYGVDNHVENKAYPGRPDIFGDVNEPRVVVSPIHHCHMLVQTDCITTIS